MTTITYHPTDQMPAADQPAARTRSRIRHDRDPAASIETLSATLSNAENALVFGGYATLALAVGTVLLCRRDTNE